MKSVFRSKSYLLFINFLFGASVFAGLHLFCEKQTDGFALQKIHYKNLEVLVPSAPLEKKEQEQVNALLDQPYTFLGMGSECFTFLSEDKTTVLKFFKLSPWRFIYFRKALSCKNEGAQFKTHYANKTPKNSFLENYLNRAKSLHHDRIENTFASCQIAWEDFKEETGVIYLHLSPTSSLKKELIIYDKLGIEHTIDLDTTYFVLQKRAELVLPTLEKHIETHNEAESKACIDSLMALIIERCKKGIADRDPILDQNFGFLGTEAIEIDLGSFSRNEQVKMPAVYKRRLYSEMSPLKSWLHTRSSFLEDYLDKKLEEFLMEPASIEKETL